MDDLEKAILISFDESGSINSVLKEQAAAFIQQVKDRPSICSICIEKFCVSNLVEVKFWCLQCLHEILRVRYPSMSLEEKDLIRKSVFSMACGEPVHANDTNAGRIFESPSFVKNKLAQVFVTLISYEYPEIWQSVFVDFLHKLSKGAAVIDMFCRVLNVMDDELISLDYPRSGDDVAKAGKKIYQSLQDTVARFTRMGRLSDDVSLSEDGSHIFEAIGLLIGMEDVPLEKQSDYLSALLTPLCQQVEAALLNAKPQHPEESLLQIENMQQTVMAINALSKGFSQRLVTTTRPGIGLMFKKTLDILLQILVVFPKVEPLRSKVTSFIHRMVDILGPSIFPYLPNALGQLLLESEPKELVGFLVLLNQLICKFATEARDILEAVYPVIASRAFSILPRNDIQSGPGSCGEEIRELQELQKTFFIFLNVIATHELSSVFLSPKSTPHLELMMHLLLHNSCNHKDINIRKACVQVFIRLIKDWCSVPYGKETVPGFQKFIIETFAVNCCLYSVLDKSFEFRDANTVLLFGEIVTAQKVMYEKFGNDFLLHFVSKCFPSIHCPQDLAEQYCQTLQGNDFKALKSFYQSLIERLRPLQNGSLVFR
ncbi:exportin-T-like [Salvia hispanica]|uniref:exportin-T-like n=1 Tax=Salvia hispanica TaxID=49212 RepID=UPI0020094D53|nr:exportin-T-like [Salvia hispanica]